MSRRFGLLYAFTPRSLHGRAVVILLWTAASILGPVVWYMRQSERTLRQQHERLVHLLSAGLLKDAAVICTELASRDSSAPPPGLDRWNASLLWLGATTPQGEVRELRRSSAPPLEQIVPLLENTRGPQGSFVFLEEVDPSVMMWRSSVASDGVRLAAIFRADPVPAGPAPWALAALAGCVGLLISLIAVNRLLCAPLTVSSAAKVANSWQQLLDNVAAPRELEELVSAMAEAQRDLAHYRSKAAALQHSLEYRVDARTRAAVREAERAARDAGTDELTGLLNRRAMNQDLPRAFAEAQEKRSSLCVAVVDLDHFKELNDLKGHQAGDDLLKFLGQLLRSILSPGQNAYRYGGDEFILVLLGADPLDVQKLAERVQALFRQRVRTLGSMPHPPDLSVGIAGLHDGAADAKILLAAADEAMYFAKTTGRGIATVAAVRDAIARGEYKPAQRAQKRRGAPAPASQPQ